MLKLMIKRLQYTLYMYIHTHTSLYCVHFRVHLSHLPRLQVLIVVRWTDLHVYFVLNRFAGFEFSVPMARPTLRSRSKHREKQQQQESGTESSPPR